MFVSLIYHNIHSNYIMLAYIIQWELLIEEIDVLFQRYSDNVQLRNDHSCDNKIWEIHNLKLSKNVY